MTLLSLLAFLLILCLVCYLVTKFIPDPFKSIIIIVIVIFVCIWLLGFTPLAHVRLTN